jgi:hypothetical protein
MYYSVQEALLNEFGTAVVIGFYGWIRTPDAMYYVTCAELNRFDTTSAAWCSHDDRGTGHAGERMRWVSGSAEVEHRDQGDMGAGRAGERVHQISGSAEEERRWPGRHGRWAWRRASAPGQLQRWGWASATRTTSALVASCLDGVLPAEDDDR